MNKTQARAIILETVRVIPSVLPYLSARTRAAIKAGYAEGGVPEITARYNNVIVESLTTYFEGGAVTAPRNQFRQAMTEAYNSAFDTGWIDGGQNLPLDKDAAAWLRAQINSEGANIDALFEQAKALRQEEGFDYFTWITARADGYTNTVSSIYNAAVLWAKKNQMLTWNLGNTEKHCATCSALNGNSHRASWYLSHNYIPRKPGADMECGGYRCDCRITDKAGNEITL